MTALARPRLGEESLETNLLSKEKPFFHCGRFLEDWREEEWKTKGLQATGHRVRWD
jgi:hypothetical protein